MALRLNLYHEVEKQKALQRRDPLKLAILGLSAVGLCFAGYYVFQLSVQSGYQRELSRLTADHATLSAKAEVAKAREEELAQTIRLSDGLVRHIEGRFYWAPVLDTLVQTVPREVQLTRVAGDVNGEALKRCSITIEGIAAGPEPRSIAEELRKSLGEKFGVGYKNVTSTFKILEDGKTTVALDGQQLSTATFTISVQLQAGEEAPAPAAEDARKS